MTEAEARALTIGAAVKDNGPGIGTVVEKHIDFFSIKWTAPPTRVEGVSTFFYEDCRLLSAAGGGGNTFFVPSPPTGGPPTTMGNTPLVLGTSFTTTAPVQITRVHFYKHPTDTGLHVATIWQASGQIKLAQASFTGETASGWQSVNLVAAMFPGTQYVVTVTRVGPGYEFLWPFPADVVKAPVTLSSTARYEASSNPNVYPTQTIAGYYYEIDITTIPVDYGFDAYMLDTSAPVNTVPGNYVLSNEFVVNKAGRIRSIRYWHASGCGGFAHSLGIWDSTGNKVASVVNTTPTGFVGYVQQDLAVPLGVYAGQRFRVSYDAGGFNYGFSNVTPASQTPDLTLVQGYYSLRPPEVWPNTQGGGAHYHADVVYQVQM